MNKKQMFKNWAPNKLSEKQEKELRNQFPKLPSISHCVEAIKNYDDTVNKLELEKIKNEELIELNNNKQERLFYVYKENERLEEFSIETHIENEELKSKLEETELKRRKTAGKVGGLTAKLHSVEKEKEFYKGMLDAKEQGLKKSKEIIDELNKKIKQLKNRPTMTEIYEYERTRKSPKKKKTEIGS